MSARGVVALANDNGFERGVFLNSDAYPTAVGPTLFEMVKQRDGDVTALWNALDSGDMGGWSSLSADQVSGDAKVGKENIQGVGIRYTDATDFRFSSDRVDQLDSALWVYAISPASETVTVYSVDLDGKWKPKLTELAKADFSGAQPDWKALEDLDRVLKQSQPSYADVSGLGNLSF